MWLSIPQGARTHSSINMLALDGVGLNFLIFKLISNILIKLQFLKEMEIFYVAKYPLKFSK